MMPTHGYGNMPNRKKLTHLTNNQISQKHDVGGLLYKTCGRTAPNKAAAGNNTRERQASKNRHGG